MGMPGSEEAGSGREAAGTEAMPGSEEAGSGREAAGTEAMSGSEETGSGREAAGTMEKADKCQGEGSGREAEGRIRRRWRCGKAAGSEVGWNTWVYKRSRAGVRGTCPRTRIQNGATSGRESNLNL